MYFNDTIKEKHPFATPIKNFLWEGTHVTPHKNLKGIIPVYTMSRSSDMQTQWFH